MGAFAIAALQAIPLMVEAGHSIASIVAMSKTAADVMTKAQAEGRDPSPAEWDALNAHIDADVAVIDAA